jgi:1-acyl-sn-glycerol-3-phosphate acyltransferase
MADKSQFRLLGQRRFAPFFVTQFLGALNDNVFRNGLVILVTFQGVAVAGLGKSGLANLAGALFILPFFLFSATAGQFADKYEKSMLMRRIKLFEIGLMILAAAAFLARQFELLLAILFLMGLQSTFFGPVKYAYLPQQLDAHELVGGNGLVEAGTFTAIVLGLIVGGLAVAVDADGLVLLVACLLAFSVLGYVAARQIPVSLPADPELRIRPNPLRETWRILGYAREDKSVFLAILGISWFWFFGSVMTLQLPAYAQDILNGNESITTWLLVAFAVGVGLGSLFCERLSGHRIELGLVPLGAIGLTVFAIDLYHAAPGPGLPQADTFAAFIDRPGSMRVMIDLALLGGFGGLYSVPLYALMQRRAEPRHLSRIIAANNIMNAVFMVAASAFAVGLLTIGLSIPELFLALAVLNAIAAIYIFRLLPEFLLRFLAWILTSIVYRVRVRGIEHIPDEGPAVVVCNHVSYVDPIILAGILRRPMRYVMWYRIFEIPVLRFFFERVRAIPIATAREDETIMKFAFEQIDLELARGNIVCIFAEGGITRDGEVHGFRSGVETVLARRPVPVIPVALGRLWGSLFSRNRTSRIRRLPGRLFAEIPVRIAPAIAPRHATAARLELIVRTLRGDDR